MESKKGSGKIFIIVVSAIILVGAGVGFWLYRKNKKSNEVKDKVTDEGITNDEVIVESSSNDIPTNDKSNDEPKSSSEITDNPFKSEDDLIKFQNWILKYHETDGIYGKGSATPIKIADGIWGKKSANAWDKYGKRYTDVHKVKVNQPKPKSNSNPNSKSKSKKPKVDESAKLKLGSDNSNVSALKLIINQLAHWKKIKSKNGINFPIATDTKFTAKTDSAVSIFFPKYKSQGYITRGQARLMWSYYAGYYNKTFPSNLVGITDEQQYRQNYAKGKNDSKKKFIGFNDNVDNFVIDANDGDNFI